MTRETRTSGKGLGLAIRHERLAPLQISMREHLPVAVELVEQRGAGWNIQLQHLFFR